MAYLQKQRVRVKLRGHGRGLSAETEDRGGIRVNVQEHDGGLSMEKNSPCKDGHFFFERQDRGLFSGGGT